MCKHRDYCRSCQLLLGKCFGFSGISYQSKTSEQSLKDQFYQLLREGLATQDLPLVIVDQGLSLATFRVYCFVFGCFSWKIYQGDWFLVMFYGG